MQARATAPPWADLGQAEGAGDQGGGHLPAVGGVAQQGQAVHPVGRSRRQLCRHHCCAGHPQVSPQLPQGSGGEILDPPFLVWLLLPCHHQFRAELRAECTVSRCSDWSVVKPVAGGMACYAQSLMQTAGHIDDVRHIQRTRERLQVDSVTDQPMKDKLLYNPGLLTRPGHGDGLMMPALLWIQDADPAGLTPERHPCDVGVGPA